MKQVNTIELLYRQGQHGVISAAETRHLPQGYFISPHCHESVELYAMTEGECAMAVNSESFTLSPGQMVLIFPHMIHSLHVQAQVGATALHIRLRPETFLHISPEIIPHLKLIRFMENPHNAFIYRHYSQPLLACMERICAEAGNGDEAHHLVLANLYMDELVFLLSREMEQNIRRAFVIKNPLVVAALQFINDNLYGPITVQMVVDFCQVSPRNLSNIFQKHVGLTVGEYINIAKVDKATELLLGTEFTILQLAAKMGFSSGQYFSTVFKRYTGVTPTEYRALSRNRPWFPL